MNLAATMSLDAAGFLNPLRQLQGGLGGLTATLGNIGNIFSGLQAAAGIARSVVGELTRPISLSADMEGINAEFGVMLQSVERGKAMAADIQKFANATPFETAGLAGNAKTLLAFGTAGEAVLPTLRMLGDVAGSSQERLDSLTLAFAQISSAGKLQGGDLLQLVNAGFNPLQEISRTTGQSMASLREQMEAGAISADMVAAAFQSATSQGGRFFNNMQVQAGTFNGLLSTLQDAIAGLYRAFGTPVMNALKPILQEATAMANALAPVVADLGARFATMVAAAGRVASTVGKGLIGALDAGELGRVFRQAVEGVPAFLLSSLSTVVGTLVRLVASGMQGAFQSALALFSDGSFWGGIRGSVMALIAELKAAASEILASLIEGLPPLLGGGNKDVVEGHRADAATERGNAESWRTAATGHLVNVDFAGVMAPMEAAAQRGGSILGEGLAALGGSIANNQHWQGMWAALQKFSHGVDGAAAAAASARDFMITQNQPNDFGLGGAKPTLASALRDLWRGSGVPDKQLPASIQPPAAVPPTQNLLQDIMGALRPMATDNLARVGGFVEGKDGPGRDMVAAQNKANSLLEKVVRETSRTVEALNKLKLGWVA